jgi:signal transduction histidine kinase
LFNAIDEGYCIIEILFDAQDQPVNYRYLEVNESFERQTGLTGAVGKTILQLIPNIESCWLQAYGKVAQTGEPVRLDDYVADMNRWFNVYAFRLGDPSKRQVGVIFSNSTERKVLEHQLLEAVVSADTANRAKSDFLASMSHELRTPLNSILGFAQLIETGEPPLTPQQKRNLDHILKGGWYLLELIDEVLDLSHIESGKLSLSLEAVSLVDILRDCQELIEPMAQKRAIRMTFTQLETAPFAFVDRIRVKQVLLNLLSNAIKYNTSHGSVVVECTLKRPGIARISIRDAGVGMTPKQIAQLFQPFNRLGREAGVEAGTGIGLVVTKRLVEMMEGTVGVESTLGKGSVFWIELPLVATPLQVLAAA